MLPAVRRLRRSSEFAAALRRGRDTTRAARGCVVAHLHVPGPDVNRFGAPVDGSARVGFVVSRVVGPAAARNRVRRRLRHLLRDLMPALPAGSRLVIRALPPAAAASSATLAGDLSAAVAAVAAVPTSHEPSTDPQPAAERWPR